MASPDKLVELASKAQKAGFGPGGLVSAIHNVFGFATNSGQSVYDRLTDEQADELIALFQAQIVTKLDPRD